MIFFGGRGAITQCFKAGCNDLTIPYNNLQSRRPYHHWQSDVPGRRNAFCSHFSDMAPLIQFTLGTCIVHYGIPSVYMHVEFLCYISNMADLWPFFLHINSDMAWPILFIFDTSTMYMTPMKMGMFCDMIYGRLVTIFVIFTCSSHYSNMAWPILLKLAACIIHWLTS